MSESDRTAEGRLRCPACGATDLQEISYGMPAFPVDPDVVLGGCVISPDSPRWACRACGLRFGLLDWGRPSSRPEAQP